MVPPALLFGSLITPEGNVLDIRAAELSPLGFLFRTEDSVLLPEHGCRAELHIRRFTEDDWAAVTLPDVQILPEETDEPFTHLWRLESDAEAFIQPLRGLLRDFRAYTIRKQSGDDAALTEWMTGTPAQEAAAFTECWQSQRYELLSMIQPDPDWAEAAALIPHTALSLETPGAWQAYLAQPIEAYRQSVLEGCGLAQHPVA